MNTIDIQKFLDDCTCEIISNHIKSPSFKLEHIYLSSSYNEMDNYNTSTLGIDI